MDDVTGGRTQRHHLGGRGRAVHEPQARVRRDFRLVDDAIDQAFAADLLDVAECFFLDRRQPPRNVSLRGLRVRQVGCLVAVDDGLVAVEHPHELGAYRIVAAACRDDLLAAGQFGRLAEHQRAACVVELVERIADGGIRAATGRRVGFAALGRHPQILQRALGALQLARILQERACSLRCPHDRVVIAVQLDAETLHRLAGFRDAVDDLLRPLVLDADDDDGGHVRVAAGADQRAEMQVEVGAEL
jgi:hypothetical protein